MGCPFTGSGSTDSKEKRDRGGIDRREFVKSALAIGGVGALGSLESVAGITSTVRAAGTRTPMGVSVRRNRQHAWDDFEPRGRTGNTGPPPNSLFLLLDYQREGEPTPGHRRQVGTALTEIERHFDWDADGVLFTMAYSAAYFDRFDGELPPGARPDPATEVTRVAEAITVDEDVTADDHDAVLLLASSNAANLLAVEAALWGEGEIDFEATFEGVFSKPASFPDRRVGFVGGELPREEYADELDVDVPDESPLSMGFVAGFGSSIPDEDAVTLKAGQRFPAEGVAASDVPDRDYVGPAGERDPGVFAQGTLKHLSHVELDLQSWYDEPGDKRRHQMYSPFHTEEETGTAGFGLTDDAGGDPGAETGGDGDLDLRARSHVGDDYAKRSRDTAVEGTELTDGMPTLGHSQKTARARYDVDNDGRLEQPVLRRDWDNILPRGSDDEARAGYHFNVPMRFNESIYTLLEATHNVAFTSLDGRIDHDGVESDDWRDRNGIVPFMTATHRTNLLVPPITLRALPFPRAADATLSVTREGGDYHVTVEGIDRPSASASFGGSGSGQQGSDRFDPETVRFGAPDRVDRGGGATPTAVDRRGGTTTFVFAPRRTGLGGDSDRARLFGKLRDDRRPVRTTVEV